MKTLHTFRDDNISKDYDLAVTTYGELRDSILTSSGLSISEMRVKFDSLTPLEGLKEQDNQDIYVKEILEFYQEKYKSKTLFNRMKKALKEDNEYSLARTFKYDSFGTRNASGTDLMKVILEFKKEFTNFLELEEVISYLKSIKYTDKVKKEDANYSIGYDLLKGFQTANSDYDLIKYVEYLVDGNDSFIRMNTSKSKTYKEDSALDRKISENKVNVETFSNGRKERAIKGLENYVFVVEKTEKGLILLDGFNRLFGSSYDNSDKEVMVKVYSDLDSKDYSDLVMNLNDWKLEKYSKGLNIAIFDRGILASLYLKFNLDIELFKKHRVTYLNYLSKNIYKKEDYYGKSMISYSKLVDSLFDIQKLAQEFEKKEYSQYFMNSIVVETRKSKDINQAIEYLNTELVNEHLEKINTFDAKGHLENYLKRNNLVFKVEKA